MKIQTKKEIPRALLVSIRTPRVSEQDSEDSLQELERLVTTLGFQVVGHERQRMPSTSGSTAVGAGKLKEIAERTNPAVGLVGGLGAGLDGQKTAPPPPTVVVFDCDLTPAQLRHIESALSVEVLDRTGVIIEIFSRHAKTRTARLQVEIARLNYLSPRIREVGSSGERQSGRGSGESALATGRREIRDKLAELKKELEISQREQAQRRSGRAEQLCVALVGYTNAGKSSTMRALTGSEVLVEDKLFATLDTTVRALQPETKPRVLVTDTVGFIKKLPHDLVASFRSTLDEAIHASALLYVVDASDPTFRSQVEVVKEALAEAGGVDNTPALLVLNKIDRLTEPEKKLLRMEFPKAIQISALDKKDVAALRARILAIFETELVQEDIFAPYDRKGIVGEIRRNMRVVRESHEENGTLFTVRADPALLAQVKKRLQRKS